MKKQKFSLQLRKQKIASLEKKQIQGGNFTTFTVTQPIETLFPRICITRQVNCQSVFLPCPTDTITMASFCCETTQPPTFLC
ncbi:hypothetical protein [Kordia sp.]|uniref:hypothetical protein n=1 Tax=Kordia sp. TaxID=1965332 RepID=UPI003B5CCBA3